MAKKKEARIVKSVKAKAAKKSAEELNKMLLENFINMQKIMIHQAEKLDKLSDNITKLLNLFELSARSFMERPEIRDVEKDKEFLDKLNALLEQNKTIAKGLTLMEEKFRERVYGQQPRQEIQQFQQQQPQQPYQSSIKKLPRF